MNDLLSFWRVNDDLEVILLNYGLRKLEMEKLFVYVNWNRKIKIAVGFAVR